MEVPQDFRLYQLGNDLHTVTELDVALDPLLASTGGSFETIVDVLSTSDGTLVQLLQDNGDTLWPGKSQASKKLPAAEQQFQGNWVALGAAAAADSTNPALAGSTPTDDATDAAANANIVLRFDEAVQAGAGSFYIKQTSDGSVVQTIAAASAQVSYAFNTVTIDPSADLAPGTAYYLEADATAISDFSGNAWAGISDASALNFTTASAAPTYSLLITEVNSNAGPSDFFELYNYGGAAIDLTGWSWSDDAAAAGTSTFAGVSSIAPGERILVAISGDASGFRAAWNLPGNIQIAAPAGAPGLGKSDAVFVYDASGGLVTALNYGTDTVSGVLPLVRTDGIATGNDHAGVSVGGTATQSAVWDAQSTAAPKYDNAAINVLGAYAQSATPANIGSPGRIASGYDLSAAAYTEDFSSSLGEFTAYSLDSDATNTWYRATSGYAEVNGYGDTAPASDWLISQAFDLSKTAAEYLSFTTWTRYSDTGTPNPEVKLFYSTNYAGWGDPTQAAWAELSYTASADNSQQTVPSGLIDLSTIQGTNVYFAFQYTSSGTGSSSASYWRVDDVKIEGYDGAVLSIAATDASKPEGQSGTTPFTFTVARAATPAVPPTSPGP